MQFSFDALLRPPPPLTPAAAPARSAFGDAPFATRYDFAPTPLRSSTVASPSSPPAMTTERTTEIRPLLASGPPSFYGLAPSPSPPRRPSDTSPSLRAITVDDSRRIALLEMFLASPVRGPIIGGLGRRDAAALVLQAAARGRAARNALRGARAVAAKAQALARGRAARVDFAAAYDGLVDDRDDRHLVTRRSEASPGRRASAWATHRIAGGGEE
jgi:hypothetical protein